MSHTGIKSRFSKNVMILTLGTGFSQMIPFISFYILQKYCYGPSDFAMAASFIFFSEMIGSVGTMKLEFAIIVQESDRSAREVAVTAMRIAFGMSFFSLLLAFLFFQFNIIPGLYELGAVIFLVPFVVLSMGMVQIGAYWLNRKENYKRIASGKLIQTSTGEGSRLAFGFSGANFSGLIIGRIIGYMVNGIWQGILFMRDTSGTEKRNFSFKDTVKNNYRYIIYAMPSVFIKGLINFLLIEMFISNFGNESSGMVSAALYYVSGGLGVVAGSVSQVYFGTIAKIQGRKEMLHLYLRFMRNLFFLSAFMTIIFWVLPEEWVIGALGDNWGELIEYCKIISLWLGVWFVSSSLSFIYIRLQKQGFMMVMDILHVGMVCAGFFIGKYISNTPLSALWGFALSQMVFYVFTIILAIGFIRKSKLLID